MSSKTKPQLISENTALQARVAKLEAGIIGGLTGRGMPVGNNVTARSKHNSDVLEASEIRYRHLFETAQNGILILDARTGKIKYANPFLEDLIGFTQAELVGKPLWEIGLFKDIVANQSMYRDLKKKEYVRYDDLPLQTKTGEQRPVEFIGNLCLVDHHRVIQCNIRDISKLKEAKITHDELVSSLAELQRHEKELHSLYKMNELLQSCNFLEEAYKVVRIMGNELFDGQKGCLSILRPLDHYLEVVLCWGDTFFMKPNFLLDDCWALRRGQLHVVQDPQAGLICRHFSQSIQTGYLCLPLMVQGEILGMICITCPDNDTHRQTQQQLAVVVGDSIKMSLSNLKLRETLREQALIDKLTGLGNRHYLEENLSRELARTLRRESSVCVAMLDLDHFKKFNDTYGHEAGDMMLHKIGDMMRKNLRQSDIVCRYGGEEFVVLLLDSSLTDVKQRLDKIREMVKEIGIQHGEERFNGVTVSIGIVEAHESDWTTGRLLRAADEALYVAKQTGRDRIVVYPAKD